MAYENRVCIGVTLLLLCVSPLMCFKAPVKVGVVHVEGKIVGGHTVPIERFPYAVQLFNMGSMCGGTILSSWSVMTAAHCFDGNKDADNMELHVGSRYTYDFAADRYDVWYFVQHEDYNKSMTFACDIALIFVSRPITFSTKTSKARLVNTDKWMSVRDSNFTTMGWGWTSYGGETSKFGLLMTDLQFVATERCNQMHNIKLTPDMFCLYGDGIRDSCKGDSGGGVEWNGYPSPKKDRCDEEGFIKVERRKKPTSRNQCGTAPTGPNHLLRPAIPTTQLYVSRLHHSTKSEEIVEMIVGIVSHGDGCAVKNKPSVYANVWYFRGWIKDQMEGFVKHFCENTADDTYRRRFKRRITFKC